MFLVKVYSFQNYNHKGKKINLYEDFNNLDINYLYIVMKTGTRA